MAAANGVSGRGAAQKQPVRSASQLDQKMFGCRPIPWWRFAACSQKRSDGQEYKMDDKIRPRVFFFLSLHLSQERERDATVRYYKTRGTRQHATGSCSFFFLNRELFLVSSPSSPRWFIRQQQKGFYWKIKKKQQFYFFFPPLARLLFGPVTGSSHAGAPTGNETKSSRQAMDQVDY